MVATTLHAMLLRSRLLKPAIRRGVGATSCLGASGRGVAASGRGVGERQRSGRRRQRSGRRGDEKVQRLPRRQSRGWSATSGAQQRRETISKI